MSKKKLLRCPICKDEYKGVQGLKQHLTRGHTDLASSEVNEIVEEAKELKKSEEKTQPLFELKEETTKKKRKNQRMKRIKEKHAMRGKEVKKKHEERREKIKRRLKMLGKKASRR